MAALVGERIVLTRAERYALLYEKRAELTSFLERLQAVTDPLEICSTEHLNDCVLESSRVSVLASQLRESCPRPTDWVLFEREGKKELQNFNVEDRFQSIARHQLKIDLERLDLFTKWAQLKANPRSTLSPKVLIAFKALIYLSALASLCINYKKFKKQFFEDTIKSIAGIAATTLLGCGFIKTLTSEHSSSDHDDDLSSTPPNLTHFLFFGITTVASAAATIRLIVNASEQYARKVRNTAIPILAAMALSKTLEHFYKRIHERMKETEIAFNAIVGKIHKDHSQEAAEICRTITSIIQQQIQLASRQIAIQAMAQVPAEPPPPYYLASPSSAPPPYQLHSGRPMPSAPDQ